MTAFPAEKILTISVVPQPALNFLSNCQERQVSTESWRILPGLGGRSTTVTMLREGLLAGPVPRPQQADQD